MVAQRFAMVGGIDDDGVLILADLLKVLHNAAHVMVDLIDHRPIGGGDIAVIGIGHFVVGVIALAVVRALVVIALEDRLFVKFTLDIFGQRNLIQNGQVAIQIFLGRVEGMMRIIAVDGKEPRLIGRLLIDKAHGLVKAPRRLAQLARHALIDIFAFRQRRRFVFHALRGKPIGIIVALPITAAGLRRVMRPREEGVAVVDPPLDIRAHGGMAGTDMQLARQTADITVIGEQTRQQVFGFGNVLTILAHAEGTRIAAGKEAGAAGRANGGLNVRPAQAHAVRRQSVDVGGMHEAVAVAAKRIAALLIGANPKNIRFCSHESILLQFFFSASIIRPPRAHVNV